MTVFEEVLVKMSTEYLNPIQYYLCAEKNFINVNQLIGKKLAFTHIGYKCLNCHREDIKIYRQGFCYDCFHAIPQAGEWIMRQIGRVLVLTLVSLIVQMQSFA